MDKTKFKVVDYILGKDKPEVINVRIYLKHFSNRINPITKSELINYLEDKGYILTSPDYMMKKDKFINYCKDKNLYNISQIKKCILSDKCIPMITIKQEELNEILGLKEERLKEAPATYKIENNKIEEKYILAYHLNEPFIIKNLEDLIEFGLKNTFVSYELIDEFNALNNDIGSAIVTHRISNHGINLSSKPIRLEIIKEKKDIYLEEKKEAKIAEEKEESFLEEKETKPIKKKPKELLGNRVKVNYETDISSNQKHKEILRYKELYRVLHYFATIKTRIFLTKIRRDEGDKSIAKLINTGVLFEEGENRFVVTPPALELIEDIINNSYINMDSMRIKKFYKKNRKSMFKLLNQNKEINSIISIIKEANKNSKETMFDVAIFCARNKLDKEFIKAFIGKKASGGIKPIREHKDVCFNCNKSTNCSKVMFSRKTNKEKEVALFEYRDVRTGEYIKKIEEFGNYKETIKDPLLMKFLISYKVSTEIKASLINCGILKKSRVLSKNAGLYCPFEDEWRLEDDILVQ